MAQKPPPRKPQRKRLPEPPQIQDVRLRPPVANLLSYLLSVLGGLIVFFTQRDREVRFHAAQSILLGVFFVVLLIAIQILGAVMVWSGADPAGVIGWFLGLLALIAIPLTVIVMCVIGYRERHVRLPVIGAVAESWAGGPVTA